MVPEDMNTQWFGYHGTMAVATGSWELTFETESTKQKEQTGNGKRLLISKSVSSDLYPPARQNYLTILKHHEQLGIN